MNKGKNIRLQVVLAGAWLVCSLLFIWLVVWLASAHVQKVSIKKQANGHYMLLAGGRPYIIKGVCYNPIPIGKNHEYDWWSDPRKPWIADGKLMKKMGINTVRFYQVGTNPESVRKVIRDLYNRFGIRVILGDWLGYWEYPCPFYADKKFQDRVKKDIVAMVELYKKEPGVLLWILGNENNYSFSGRINCWSSPEIEKEPDPRKQRLMRAKIYYSFVNDLTKAMHEVDPRHPVALGNGELVGLDSAAEYCPDVDLIACIIYRGKSFGNIFKALKTTFDRPVFLAEFGADAYDAYRKKEDQNMQAFFLEAQWRQIYENIYFSKEGEGNCLGGTMFEWNDEWWKHEEPNPQLWSYHDTESNWSNGSYYFDVQAPGNMNMNEEWFGIVALSPEMKDGLNKRMPRKAYYVIKELWKNPASNGKNKKSVKPQ